MATFKMEKLVSASGDNDLSSSISMRLRDARRAAKLSLRQAAERTGVSISALSKIENALVLPSFDVIKRICDGMGLALEDVIRSPAKPGITGRKTVTKTGEAEPFSSGTYDYLVHSTELARKWMVPMEIVVRAHSIDDFEAWSQHDGEEYVYILSGAIEIHTEEYAPFVVSAGESAYFDSGMKHLYISVGPQDAHILSVSCDPNRDRQVGPYIKPKVPM